MEPLTLLPLLAAGGASRLILVGVWKEKREIGTMRRNELANNLSGPPYPLLPQVGDPQQLPPPVNMHARDAPPTSNPSSAPPSLGAHLLRDGINREDRGPVVGRLPPLVWIDVPHGSEQQVGEMEGGREGRGRTEKNLLPPSRRGAPPSHVKVSTVDAFQGAEREVILYSCVRTGGLGFLDSPNRLNVAITRARRHLVLVGNAQALVMLSVLGRKGGPGGEGLGGGGGGGEGGSKPG
ncbi:prematurely terminated mrna decay factor-like protein, partial [Nannochloropsis gaditana CCMP526]|uniref:prematurely terminated mrna decay factor-like protein n=1 Tax=Nannochloropsis gaditana (strain CCMP526) TaxID=1093141 RepID=UPI00029F657A